MADPQLSRSMPTISCEAKDWNDVIMPYRNGRSAAGFRMEPRSPDPRTPSRWPGPTASARVFLVVFKQPGANVIDTVQIKAQLPRPDCVDSATIKVSIIERPHPDIRGCGHDVQFTLLLTIFFLFVMVIFVFLRNVWATIIPASRFAGAAGRLRPRCGYSATRSTICR